MTATNDSGEDTSNKTVYGEQIGFVDVHDEDAISEVFIGMADEGGTVARGPETDETGRFVLMRMAEDNGDGAGVPPEAEQYEDPRRENGDRER